MSNVITLDLAEVAEEWQERLDELCANVPNTKGMSWGEVIEATETFLREPEQVEYVAAYVELCEQLRLEPVEPDTLKYADRLGVGTLISEDTFTDYAREYAHDIYGDLGPLESFVNWDAFANSIKQDYEDIEYDGHTWLRRA